MIHGFLNKVQRSLARSRFAARVCVKVRNQANRVVGYYLGGESSNSSKNGEFSIMERIAPECKLFIDIGANMGGWTQHFMTLSKGRGFLYEPGKGCFEHLEKTMTDPRLTLRHCAVGDVSGQIEFVEDLGFTEHSSIATTFNGSDNVVRYTVPLITIDQEFAGSSETIDFLKIDTEGYDFNVIKGCQKLLEEGRVRFVQFEYNINWIHAGSTIFGAIDFLKRYGYDTYIIRAGGISSIDLDYWGEYASYSNYIAFQKKDADLLKDLHQGNV
ncbi:MAG: FkbM family methyltransferase [Armatimonas sp.]